MNWLVELKKHCGVKFNLLIVTNELKHERLVKDGVRAALNYLRRVTILQEANRDAELLIWAHIDKINESITA